MIRSEVETQPKRSAPSKKGPPTKKNRRNSDVVMTGHDSQPSKEKHAKSDTVDDYKSKQAAAKKRYVKLS